jgi:hypothetical protein
MFVESKMETPKNTRQIKTYTGLCITFNSIEWDKDKPILISDFFLCSPINIFTFKVILDIATGLRSGRPGFDSE